MAVDARTEKYQHFELFDKPALFTNARIDRSTVPKGWYCYDFRGTDNDPGELRYIGENVVVNHAGSVLMPEKLDIPYSGHLDAWDAFGFLDEADITLQELNEAHFSNIFIEKRASSCPQSLEKSGRFSFALLTSEGENSQNVKRIFLRKVVI